MKKTKALKYNTSINNFFYSKIWKTKNNNVILIYQTKAV